MENSIILPQSPALTKAKRGYLSLEDADWQSAAKFFDEALDLDPEYAYAYLGLLCAELKVTGESQLNNCSIPFTENPNFKKAARFADEELKDRLDKYIVKNTTFSNVSADVASARVGSLVRFGGHDWRVLDIQSGKALLITENIVEQRAYHNSNVGVTWEVCDLRKYLNGEFYGTLGGDMARVVRVTNKNLNNQWYNTPGGNDTEDYVFLLSLEEAAKYFGDSGELLNNRGDRIENHINDGNNPRRIAKIEGEEHWWWLRSPGNLNDDGSARNAEGVLTASVGVSGYADTAAVVFADGMINMDGNTVNSKFDGVRPAVWVSV